MSIHPNAIMMMVYEGDAAETIYNELDGGEMETTGSSAELQIGGTEWRLLLMQDSYDESDQISAPEGSLVFFDLITYGYGDTIAWEKCVAWQAALEAYGKELVQKHGGKISFYITANYW